MKSRFTHKKSALRPVVLVIMDGWGIAPMQAGNAIEYAKKKEFNLIWRRYPHTVLFASGQYVGLPAGQPGNSEAGHMNMGAGRVVDQEALRITKAIKDGSFFTNPVFIEAIRHVKEKHSSLHLVGMLTQKRSGHADPNHLLALLKLTRSGRVQKVFLHLFTDGRDSSPYVALKLVNLLSKQLRGEQISTIMGRFYAMDRRKYWERTQKAYEAMVMGKGFFAESAGDAITESYNRKESDEFIPPYVLRKDGKPIASIQDRDAIIFFNFRSDRARQLTKAFVQKDFERQNPSSFQRKKVLKNIMFVAMTDFGPDLENTITAYPSLELTDTLPMSLLGTKQLYISESEKYAHVNYFFNGGYSKPVAGEIRIKIDSPDVPCYDVVPEMSAKTITKTALSQLSHFDFIVINYANVDMIGHTGNFKAALAAVECVSEQIGKLKKAVLACGGVLMVTADHGNAECMINPKTNEIMTEHTTSRVPCILVSSQKNILLKKKTLPLSAVAPTIVKLFGRPVPKAMTTPDLFLHRHPFL